MSIKAQNELITLSRLLIETFSKDSLQKCSLVSPTWLEKVVTFLFFKSHIHMRNGIYKH